MTDLVDRYVWAVLGAVPDGQRADLEPEIRALVADAMEARAGDGTDPADVERAALTELGDPEALAARYTGRASYLVGPRYYPDWKRVLSVLLAVVVPITAISVVAASFLSGDGIVEILVSGLATAFGVGVMLAFMVTLGFALQERSEAGTAAGSGGVWTLDELPALPAPDGPRLAETVLSVIVWGFAAIALVWQQIAMTITIDGRSYPLFDPGLWLFWLPWLLAIVGLNIVFAIALYRRGRWTWSLAVVNGILVAAFVIPVVWLAQTGRLFDPGLVEVLEGRAPSVAVAGLVVIVMLVAVTTFGVAAGFLKAHRASLGPNITRA